MSERKEVNSLSRDITAVLQPFVPADIDTYGRQLTGRTVGIVGFGGIGPRLAELLKPFGVGLRVYDPYVPAAVFKKHKAQAVTVRELMKRSDVVVLCAASTGETTHLVGRREIAAMRKHTLLVNVGRSALVDMEALQERLERDEIFACPDVFDKEPLEAKSPLRKLSNVYMTPHRAGGLMESMVRILNWLADDYEAFLGGKRRGHALKESMIDSLG